MFSYLVFWNNSRICAGFVRIWHSVRGERLLLYITIWIAVAGFIPVLDHSLQGLWTSGQESLESTVVARCWSESFICSYLAVFSVWNTPNSGNAAWHIFGLFLCTCIQNNNLGFLFIILYWWFGFLIFQQQSSSSYDAWELPGLVIGSLRDNCCSPSWVYVGIKCIMVKVCKGL